MNINETSKPCINNINCEFDINQPKTECEYIKIISWNADGLKRHLSKSHLLTMLRNYDIICIQETWANNYEQYMDLFDGYNAFSTCTAKRANRGRTSGGIIVYIKEWLSPFMDFMFKSEIAIFLFLKAENMRLPKHNIMGFTYIPPEKSTFYNMYDESYGILMLREQIAKALSLKKGSSLSLTEDFNARTGNLIDFIKDDRTQFFTGNNIYEPDNFLLPRFSKDIIINKFGKDLINMCHETGTHFPNGRFPWDKSGEKHVVQLMVRVQ